jgi:hypothetical protein
MPLLRTCWDCRDFYTYIDFKGNRAKQGCKPFSEIFHVQFIPQHRDVSTVLAIYITLNMLQTSSNESAASAAVILVAALGGVSLMPAGSAFFIHLVYFAVPMAIICALAHLTSTGAGWVAGSTVAFAAVAILETVWEQRIYTGPNSMPGFVYLFLCGPLAIIGLVIACPTRRWLRSTELRFSVAAAAVFFACALPVLGSLVGSKHV